MFGFIDVLGVRGGQTIAVQTTSASNVASRVRKIAASDNLAAIISAHWIIEVHGWRKGKRGPPTIRTLDDITEARFFQPDTDTTEEKK